MHCSRITSFVLLSLLVFTACPGKKKGGNVEGTVSPAGSNIRIVALQQGKSFAQTEASSQDGKFRIVLPAGTYEIQVKAPSSAYPLTLSGIVVRPGETTSLASISLAVPKGTGSISGRVLGTGAGTHLVLLAEGIERAAINTGADGKYEFEDLPAGNYTLQVSSAGYANDSFAVNVSDNRKTSKDIRMLYTTTIDGIDWNTGRALVRGIGLPPKQAPTPTIRREMAKRAAVADAERNLLRIIELINVGPGQKITEAINKGTFEQKLQGYLQGYRIAAERDMDGGKVEVELELPLTGPGGLTSILQP